LPLTYSRSWVQIPRAEKNNEPDRSQRHNPVYNEEKNIGELYSQLSAAGRLLSKSHEFVFIDDGSDDGSLRVLKEIAAKDPAVSLISLNKNYGQTLALAAGIKHSKGKIIVTMDAGPSERSADIHKLLELMDKGYDVVKRLARNTARTHISQRSFPAG